MELDDALAALLAEIQPVAGTEVVAVTTAAGRVAANPVIARSPVPPFANSAMDGYAVRASDPMLASGALKVIDTSWAGQPATAVVRDGTCVRIFTGAVMPEGADAVVAQEDAQVEGDGRVRFTEASTAGRFVRPAGGDFDAGAAIVQPGTRLHAGHAALIASAGRNRVDVHRRPRVAIVVTGDELVAPDADLAPGQIHGSNDVALQGLLQPLPVEVSGVHHAPDDPEELRAVLDRAADSSDAVISAGGVSVGDADHVRAVLESRGHIGFWRLALKPGRPFAWGRYGDRAFFGLPGNPVSSAVTFLLLVRPALQKMAGMTPTPPLRLAGTLTAPLRKAPGRRDFQRGVFEMSAPGEFRVTALERQDSNILSTMADANCLLDLSTESGDRPAGETVAFLPLRSLMD